MTFQIFTTLVLVLLAGIFAAGWFAVYYLSVLSKDFYSYYRLVKSRCLDEVGR